MRNDVGLPEAVEILSNALDIPFRNRGTVEGNHPVTREDLKNFLLPHITAMLDRKPEYLMSILYRIDVSEEKVQFILRNSPIEQIASQLADLIIDRELQKITTRRAYRQLIDESNK